MKPRALMKLSGLLLSAAAAFGALPASATVGGGPTSAEVLGQGSDTTEALMMHLDGLYTLSEGCAKWNPTTGTHWYDFSCLAPDPSGTVLSENYKHDRVHEADFIGSGGGITQLCTQGQANVSYIDFARSSRGPKTTDCTGLHFVAYARDGISMESNSNGTASSGIFGMNNPDPACAGKGFCLTQNQLKAMYLAPCSITNWSQVGGQNVPIQLYTPQSGSGTRSQFETFLGGDSTSCMTAAQKTTNQIPENQNEGIAAADKTSAIFPFSYAIYSTEVNNAGGYALSAIDGVVPSSTTVADGSFPYGRFIYNVFCSTNAAGTCGALPGHIVTDEANNYVNEEGWICKPGSNENAGWVGAGTPAVTNTLPHGSSPHYLNNWQFIIQRKITKLGFGPLAVGVIGGGDINSDHCRLFTT